MAFDTPDYRELIRPQDFLAILITLLGVAIAIFLPDSVVKLIGGCIAALGGLAFWMTIKGRLHDRIQLRKKRTTLPTPAFKTRVTTDPKTSATRISFDDFQERFSFAEGEDGGGGEAAEDAVLHSAHHVTHQSGATPDREAPVVRTVSSSVDESGEGGSFSVAGSSASATSRAFDDFDEEIDDDIDAEVSSGEGFRVIAPRTAGSSGAPVSPGAEKRSTIAQPPAAAVSPDRGTQPAVRPEAQPGKDDRGKKKKRGKQKEERRQETERAAQRPLHEPIVKTTPIPAVPDVPDVTSAGAVAAVGVTAVEVDAAQMQIASDGAVRRQIRLMLDELTEGEDEVDENEPRAEFVRLVDQVLKAVARSIAARSILFFWVNHDRGHWIPEAYVSTSQHKVRLGGRVQLGSDLVSQIADSGVPEIVTNISQAAANELLPYYTSPTVTRSFVGVPVYFRHDVVGVLAADSDQESGFDDAAVATLAEYTVLISKLIQGYTEKFDLYLTQRGLEAFERLHRALTGRALQPKAIADLLIEQAINLFDSRYAAVVLFDKEAGEWRVSSAWADSDAMKRQLSSLRPDMRESIVGRATRFAEEIYVPKVVDEIRISGDEDLNRGGSFLALPLLASSKCYGAVVLGHSANGAWVPRDVDLLRDLTRYVAMAIEVVNTNEVLEEQLVFDEDTGLYNPTFLLGNLDREIVRSRDFKTPLSFALVRVEVPTEFSFDNGEVSQVSLGEISQILASRLRPYDMIGRLDSDTFGVVLVGRNDQEAFLWAERLRKEVAGKIIPYGERKFSVTMSAGVCDAGETDDRHNVIDGARRALDKAHQDGGNAVVIY